MQHYMYTALFAVSGMIAILSLVMGLEKMIRIIMANYFIASIILALSNFIDLITSQLLLGRIERRVDGLQHWIGKLLVAGKPTALLTVYFILLLFLITKSRIGLGSVKNDVVKYILTLLFLPCTVLSILLSIAVAIFGSQMVSVEGLRTLAYNVANIPYAYNLVMLTPLRIILPGLVTILAAILVLRKYESGPKDITIELENK